MTEPDSPVEVGERFHITARLGSGGMGIVYQAWDAHRGMDVALKLLRTASPEGLFLFKREFRSLAEVVHPNLVSLYDLISSGDRWFFTMELIDGADSLVHILGTETQPTVPAHILGTETQPTVPDSTSATVSLPAPDQLQCPTAQTSSPTGSVVLSPDQVRSLRECFGQLVEGISAVHAAGYLHRDIKPSNVRVTTEGRVVVLDFGIVAALSDTEAVRDRVMGTPSYMSPEQAGGRALSEASDFYSVGVMLYRTITGTVPFAGQTQDVLRNKQIRDAVPIHLRAPDAPADLSELCMDLLRRRPELRPTGPEILARLGHDPRRPRRWIVRAARDRSILVGRERELDVLHQALAEVRNGRNRVALVYGPSGMGKSTLVKRFLYQVRSTDDVLVVTGRCHERESVPYKAVDTLIDAIAQHLYDMSEAELGPLLPPGIGDLARMFPVLRRVDGIVRRMSAASDSSSPSRQRARGVAALEELIRRIALRRPLVLHVDDLHWGDRDSALLLVDLLGGSNPPPLLFIATYRSDEADASPFLRELLSALESVVPVPIARLGMARARDLAQSLLAEIGVVSPDLAAQLARESQGNPFFLSELVRFIEAHGVSELKANPTLHEVVRLRTDQLPDDTRRLLNIVAVAGRALGQGSAHRAAGLKSGGRREVTALTGERLIRTRATDADGARATPGSLGLDDTIEVYHDRIREIIVAGLLPHERKDYHHCLATALLAEPDTNLEALAFHLDGAGDLSRAADYYSRAADRAMETLAFDRAASLYSRALELVPARGEIGATRTAQLATALAYAGRTSEAAVAFREAAREALPEDRFDFLLQSAEHFLTSGQVDPGLEASHTVLAQHGMALARTPGRAVIGLLARRARLALHGLRFHERPQDSCSREDRARIDMCYALSKGLSMVDPIRSSDLHTRGLLMALAAGDVHLVARALGLEITFRGTEGARTWRHTKRLIERAVAIAERSGHPYNLGCIQLHTGMAHTLTMHSRTALDHLARAEQIFLDQCTGITWEIDTARYFQVEALLILGAMRRLAQLLPAQIEDACRRGDLYGETILRGEGMCRANLAADDPEAARSELRLVVDRWSNASYNVQHHLNFMGSIWIALYSGDGESAWRLVEETWPKLKPSLLLRVQFVRLFALYFRGQTALAAAGAGVPALIAHAAQIAARLDRERVAAGRSMALLLKTGVALAGGRTEQAVELLRKSLPLMEECDLGLFLWPARWRLGEIVGGSEGADLMAAARTTLASEGIRNPSRWVDVFCPSARRGLGSSTRVSSP